VTCPPSDKVEVRFVSDPTFIITDLNEDSIPKAIEQHDQVETCSGKAPEKVITHLGNMTSKSTDRGGLRNNINNAIESLEKAIFETPKESLEKDIFETPKESLEEEIIEIPEPVAVSNFNDQLNLSKEILNEESELILEKVPDIVSKLDAISETKNGIESLETDIFKTPKNNAADHSNANQLNVSQKRSNEVRELIIEIAPETESKLKVHAETNPAIESLDTEVFKTPKNYTADKPNAKSQPSSDKKRLFSSKSVMMTEEASNSGTELKMPSFETVHLSHLGQGNKIAEQPKKMRKKRLFQSDQKKKESLPGKRKIDVSEQDSNLPPLVVARKESTRVGFPPDQKKRRFFSSRGDTSNSQSNYQVDLNDLSTPKIKTGASKNIRLLKYSLDATSRSPHGDVSLTQPKKQQPKLKHPGKQEPKRSCSFWEQLDEATTPVVKFCQYKQWMQSVRQSRKVKQYGRGRDGRSGADHKPWRVRTGLDQTRNTSVLENSQLMVTVDSENDRTRSFENDKLLFMEKEMTPNPNVMEQREQDNLDEDTEVSHLNYDEIEDVVADQHEKLSSVMKTTSNLSQQFLRCLSDIESQIKSIPPGQKPMFLKHAKRLSQLSHQFTFDIISSTN